MTSFVEGSAIFFRLVSFVVFAFDAFCGLIFEEAGLLFEDLLRRRVFGSSSALNKNHGKRELLEKFPGNTENLGKSKNQLKM